MIRADKKTRPAPAPVFRLTAVPDELRKGLASIAADHPRRLGKTGAWKRAPKTDTPALGTPLSFQRDDALPTDGFVIEAAGQSVTIRYGSVSCAFRALGQLLARDASEQFGPELTAEGLPTLSGGPQTRGVPLSESTPFAMRGLMLDCSRNGVIRPETLKAFMRRVALMGVNMIMLYTEDTYEVPGEPFFGYLRGRYTRKELKDLDDYAFSLGIEMIPCIQTLGHLAQILQWDPYFPLRDTADILLPGEEKTYDFIRKLIRAASGPFRSRRIHLGMDEAYGLGTGRYKQLHPDARRDRVFDIMNEHLARVRTISAEEGLKPMIWSDMYFSLGSKTHNYYDLDWQLPADVIQSIPKDVQLVYWDYYHEDPAFYRKMIANHRLLGSEPVMAGGIWTWQIQWCALRWSFTAVRACLTACRQEGLKEVFMTMWGDDGAECDVFSALPGIQFFCEMAFDESADVERTARAFRGACGCDMGPWVRAADINTVPAVKQPHLSHTNTAKSLLWQDPLLAIMDKHTGGMDLQPHYETLAKELAQAAKAGGLAEHLRYPELIAQAVAAKVNLRRRLAAAYRQRDKKALRALRDKDLRRLRRAVAALWKHHRALWMANNKPFGWEVQEQRYGGLLARLDTVRDRVGDYLAGRIDAIPELQEKILNPWADVTDTIVPVNYHRLETPSCIK